MFYNILNVISLEHLIQIINLIHKKNKMTYPDQKKKK